MSQLYGREGFDVVFHQGETREEDYRMKLRPKGAEDLLIAAGKDLAEADVRSAIETAGTCKQMNGQLFVLKVRSIAVLSTLFFNEIVQNKKSLDSCLEELADIIKIQVEEMKSLPLTEADYVQPGVTSGATPGAGSEVVQ